MALLFRNDDKKRNAVTLIPTLPAVPAFIEKNTECVMVSNYYANRPSLTY